MSNEAAFAQAEAHERAALVLERAAKMKVKEIEDMEQERQRHLREAQRLRKDVRHGQ